MTKQADNNMFNLQHTEELSEQWNLQVCSGYQTVGQTDSLLAGHRLNQTSPPDFFFYFLILFYTWKHPKWL